MPSSKMLWMPLWKWMEKGVSLFGTLKQKAKGKLDEGPKIGRHRP